MEEKLIKASRDGNINEVAGLLKQGINTNFDVSVGDYTYRTPLQLAAENGHTKIVEMLIQAGANVNYINSGTWYLHKNKTALHLASEKGNAETVKLLIQSGADVNKHDGGNRLPLEYAVNNNRRAIIKLLLQAGASHYSTSSMEYERIYTVWNEIKLEEALLKFQEQFKELQAEITQLKHQAKELKSQNEILGLENNQNQKELVELRAIVKDIQSINAKSTYQGKEAQIIKTQAVLRGFFVRKQEPLSKLKKERKQMVLENEKAIKNKLFEAENYDELSQFNQAIKKEDWHRARQIILDKSEQEFDLGNNLKINY